MSSNEVPSTQDSMNNIDSYMSQKLWGWMRSLKTRALHRDTGFVMLVLIIVIFIFIYVTRYSVTNTFQRLHVLSGLIFIFILIKSFEKALDQQQYDIETLCNDEVDDKPFTTDASNRFYVGFSFLYYVLNVFIKAAINVVTAFCIIYIIYLFVFNQSEGPTFRLEFNFKKNKVRGLILVLLIIPVIIRFSELVTFMLLGGTKRLPALFGGEPMYFYMNGLVLKIREFKEFVSPDHLLNFANIMIPENLMVHKYVLTTALIFSTIYGFLFINPVNLDNVCATQQISKQLLERLHSQMRFGLLICLTICIAFYVAFIFKRLIKVL